MRLRQTAQGLAASLLAATILATPAEADQRFPARGLPAMRCSPPSACTFRLRMPRPRR